MGDENQGKKIKVQCFPLYSLLLAINQTRVDFLSLDVEGDEVKVLQTIPYRKVDIKMMTVEYAHGEGGKEDIRIFSKQKGYSQLVSVSRRDMRANDIILRKKGFYYWNETSLR